MKYTESGVARGNKTNGTHEGQPKRGTRAKRRRGHCGCAALTPRSRSCRKPVPRPKEEDATSPSRPLLRQGWRRSRNWRQESCSCPSAVLGSLAPQSLLRSPAMLSGPWTSLRTHPVRLVSCRQANQHKPHASCSAQRPKPPLLVPCAYLKLLQQHEEVYGRCGRGLLAPNGRHLTPGVR